MVSKHRGVVGAQAPEGPSPSAHTTQLGVDPSTTQYTPHRLTPPTTLHAPSLARSRQQDATPSLSSITLSLPSLFSRSCHLVGGDSSWLAFPLSSDLCSSSPLEGHCCSPRRLPPSRSAPRRRTPPLARGARGPSRLLGRCVCVCVCDSLTHGAGRGRVARDTPVSLVPFLWA